VIISFKDKATEKIWNGKFSKKIPSDIQRAAKRKLIIIHGSIDLNDLRVPPGNRLHTLDGNRLGQHNIRINDHWRICFKWDNGNAYDVEVTDYH